MKMLRGCIADETGVSRDIRWSRCESCICCSHVSVLCLLTYGLRKWSEFNTVVVLRAEPPKAFATSHMAWEPGDCWRD